MRPLFKRCFPIAVITLLSLLFFGCGVLELGSKWRDRAVVIDGVDSGAEWENARNYLDKKKVTVGLMNDENTLFIRLSTRDRAIQRQLMAQGFTIWFDDRADNKKNLGIHFPAGMAAMRSGAMSGGKSGPQGGGPPEGGPDGEETSPDDPQSDGDDQKRPNAANAMLDAMRKELEIIGPDKDQREKVTVGDAEKLGIKCRIGMADGNLVCEAHYPLHRTESNHYGIMRKETPVIRIGFETGKMDGSQMRNAPGGGGMGGGRGGMGGGMRGGMGGGRAGMGGGMGPGGMGRGMGGQAASQSLELWIQVHLAAKPDNASVEALLQPRIKILSGRYVQSGRDAGAFDAIFNGR